MDVIVYVLIIAALVGVYLLAAFLSLRFCRREDVSFPVDDSDGEDEMVLEHHAEADVHLPMMAVGEGDDDEGERPSLDWRDRAEVIDGGGRRLRVVRPSHDLREVPSPGDAPELGDRCPHGEAIPSEQVMPPEGA